MLIQCAWVDACDSILAGQTATWLSGFIFIHKQATVWTNKKSVKDFEIGIASPTTNHLAKVPEAVTEPQLPGCLYIFNLFGGDLAFPLEYVLVEYGMY